MSVCVCMLIHGHASVCVGACLYTVMQVSVCVSMSVSVSVCVRASECVWPAVQYACVHSPG